jgi:hypothetical protein
MSRDVSVEFRADGEVVITKHADTPEARETVEALRRAIESFNENSPEFTAGAYDPPPGDGDEEDDEDETETELSPRERARRQRQLAERIAESGRLESTAELLKGVAMMDSETLIEKINAAGLGLVMVKRFLEKTDSDELTEQQVTDLLLGAWGAEFGKRFQAQDEEGRIARAAVMKARDAGWFKPTAVETGERALANTTPARGEKANPLREQIVRDKAVASPFLSQEQLAAYADAMVAELERMARGKQERARPGTLENV